MKSSEEEICDRIDFLEVLLDTQSLTLDSHVGSLDEKCDKMQNDLLIFKKEILGLLQLIRELLNDK